MTIRLLVLTTLFLIIDIGFHYLKFNHQDNVRDYLLLKKCTVLMPLLIKIKLGRYVPTTVVVAVSSIDVVFIRYLSLNHHWPNICNALKGIYIKRIAIARHPITFFCKRMHVIWLTFQFSCMLME